MRERERVICVVYRPKVKVPPKTRATTTASCSRDKREREREASSNFIELIFLSLSLHTGQQQQHQNPMREETWKLHTSPHHTALVNGPGGPKFMYKKIKFSKTKKERRKEWETTQKEKEKLDR